MATIKASTSLPLTYRLLLTTIEPLYAFLGAIIVLRDPSSYLSSMTRHSAAFAADSAAFLFTQLSGAWLLFAFNEAVVLRLVDDLRVWRLLCAGMLLSDAATVHATAQAVGGWSAYADLSAWTTGDWVVFWTTAPTALVRVLIVLGIGLRKQGGKRRE